MTSILSIQTDPERLLLNIPTASITLCEIQSCAIVDGLLERIKKDGEIICQVYPREMRSRERSPDMPLTTRITNSDGCTVRGASLRRRNLVAEACNVPNLLVIAFCIELIRAA